MPAELGDALRRAAEVPRTPLDIETVWRRGRRRRHGRQAFGLVMTLVLVVGVSAIAVATSGSGSSPRVQTADSSGQTVQGNAASLTTLSGWQQLPVLTAGIEPITGDSSVVPPEVVVVGTTERPSSPIVACNPVSGSAAYVVVRAGAIGPIPAGQSPSTAPPRPSQFTPTNGARVDCGAVPSTSPSSAATTPTTPISGVVSSTTSTTTSLPSPVTTTPAVESQYHARIYTFSDAGYAVLGEVVSVGDPTETLLHQGITILNTLRLAAGAPTTTTLPSNGTGPKDPVAARQAIQDAFNSAFDNTGPVPQADSVEGGFPLSGASQQTGRNANPADIGSIVVRINWLVFLDPTQADLNFDLLVNNQPITANTTGTAILQGGIWRVGRSTYCDIVNRGGTIACPS